MKFFAFIYDDIYNVFVDITRRFSCYDSKKNSVYNIKSKSRLCIRKWFVTDKSILTHLNSENITRFCIEIDNFPPYSTLHPSFIHMDSIKHQPNKAQI